MPETVLYTLYISMHWILAHLPESWPYEAGALIIIISLEKEPKAQRGWHVLAETDFNPREASSRPIMATLRGSRKNATWDPDSPRPHLLTFWSIFLSSFFLFLKLHFSWNYILRWMVNIWQGRTPFSTLTLIPPQTTASHVHFCSHHSFPLSPDVASKSVWKKKVTHNGF